MNKIFCPCFLVFFLWGCISPPPIKAKSKLKQKNNNKKTPLGSSKILKKTTRLPKRTEEKFSFQIRGDRKRIPLHPSFFWTFPKSWKIRKVLLNIYQTGEFEKGRGPEIIVFDLAKRRKIQLGAKPPRLNYYGKNSALQLTAHTNYTALLVVEAIPATTVKKIEFITEKK